jgi:hypothetical protein
MGLSAGVRARRWNVAHSPQIIQGPPVCRVMISVGCKVVMGNLAEQFERSLKVFNQVIENKRIDYLIVANTFHAFGHHLMKLVYAHEERRAGI